MYGGNLRGLFKSKNIISFKVHFFFNDLYGAIKIFMLDIFSEAFLIVYFYKVIFSILRINEVYLLERVSY